MKHDIEATYVASELARELSAEQKKLFKVFRRAGAWTVTTNGTTDKDWPYADGMILVSNGKGPDVKIALEYKRPNEGLHGILTALGQAFAYLAKGYDATIIVIPDKYDSCADPGEKIVKFIETANKKAQIAVYTYDPHLMSVSFTSMKGKLLKKRDLIFTSSKISKKTASKASDTIWTHFREGSSEFDDVYKYCYELKMLDETKKENLLSYSIPAELKTAISAIDSSVDPYIYLSNSTVDENRKNRVWRKYWFEYMLLEDSMTLYEKRGTKYEVKTAFCKVLSGMDKKPRQFFSVVKKKIVADLNKGKINENQAWIQFAEKIHDRAHSYRIDIEAFTSGIEFVDSDNKLTLLGHRYVGSCIGGDAFLDIPKKIFTAAYLNNGNLNVFLQFFYQVSEEFLAKDKLKWSEEVRDKKGNVVGYKFNELQYCTDIEDKFFKDLHIIRKVSIRSGKKRPPFKAELCGLKMMELVGDSRVGCGLPIDWIKVQAINEYYIANRL
ncbi:hypothetical protein [Aminipila sp.]|uniref:hypothetical protein n=1 Tax=Aminipila sp. TaxID=2060095 RepID=UPI0028A2083E|nr:hypothetical protein [Aminipila sp.]